VQVENTGSALAFQVHLKLVDPKTQDEYLPVFWEDNYFALLPGERRTIGVSLSAPADARVTVEGWNLQAPDAR